ncbi:hypothetical protein [Sphingomonas solaris]|uniref:Uncharacterized protein n=1 Tax=Alterirhizorhabdus solaris TaxID=2529389 RepID=A0A558QRU8_9SPHN|nr:hypothetical protein [Sphingomonas solaris]TVV69880.1 hypothetical protein FOY91_20550 [Sphingomonas solaris]
MADRGFWTDGLDDWIDTGFAPASGGPFQQDDACIGGFFRKTDRNPNQPIGTHSANAISVTTRNAGGIPVVRLNSTSALATGAAVTSSYGLVVANRSGTVVTGYRNGAAFGSTTGASSARSTVTIGIGKQSGASYSGGQFCLFFAGAALTAAEHADLHAALSAYLATIGVAEIVSTARILSLAGGLPLPDGSAAASAGKGMGCTGLMRRPDGKWFVANGIAGRTDPWWSRMLADFATVEAEYRASSLGRSPDYRGSIQGRALDTSDSSLWAILKLAGAGGGSTYLIHFDIAGETLLGWPVPIATSDTGIAYDPAADALWITRDGGSGSGSLVLYSKAGEALTGTVAKPGDTDQCFSVAVASGAFLAGNLLATAGANGADGTITVYNRLDYGGMTVRRVDTLTSAQQIEGAVLHGSVCYVCNDGATHPGARGRN